MEHVHSLCLIKGNESQGYPELYDTITDYASQNYAVIYAVEDDTTRAVRNMSRHGAEVEELVESGALTLVGRSRIYSAKTIRLDGHVLLNSWHDLMLEVKKKSDCSGIVAIGSAEAFFEHSVDPCKLIKYEEMVGKKFQIPLKAICCYSANAVSRLSLGQLVAVLNAHHSTIHGGGRNREWQPYRIIDLARGSLEKELGADLSNLIFKTMKLCYKVGERDIIANPAVLEGMLRRIMGKSAAEVTLAHVKEQVRKFISF
jgi:hypothetical protein